MITLPNCLQYTASVLLAIFFWLSTNLSIKVFSKRLLALDTKDSDDAAYFGTAFINGNATIKGPTNNLEIKVDAKSEKGTSIKIPINDAEAIGTSSYLHFLTKKEKYNYWCEVIDSICAKTFHCNTLRLFRFKPERYYSEQRNGVIFLSLTNIKPE